MIEFSKDIDTTRRANWSRKFVSEAIAKCKANAQEYGDAAFCQYFDNLLSMPWDGFGVMLDILRNNSEIGVREFCHQIGLKLVGVSSYV